MNTKLGDGVVIVKILVALLEPVHALFSIRCRYSLRNIYVWIYSQRIKKSKCQRAGNIELLRF